MTRNENADLAKRLYATAAYFRALSTQGHPEVTSELYAEAADKIHAIAGLHDIAATAPA